jgi:hypothetical protein
MTTDPIEPWMREAIEEIARVYFDERVQEEQNLQYAVAKLAKHYARHFSASTHEQVAREIVQLFFPPKLGVKVESQWVSVQEIAPIIARHCNERERVLRQALVNLVDAAESYAADQSGATDSRCGLVQPITVAEGEALNTALRTASAALAEPRQGTTSGGE